MKDCPYSAKLLGDHEYSPGTWNGQCIGVFDGDKQIGEYLRNYHSFGERTFAPFEQKGEWFALYSKDYTCTRLMRLPSCEDIGGESPCGHGFCPVDLYVPLVCTQDIITPKPYNPRHDPTRWATVDASGVYHWRKDDPDYKRLVKEHDEQINKWYEDNPFTEKYAPFGFVAGCHWGDDSSWKIQFIDLIQACDGIITRDERFGYIELPANVQLKDAIELSNYDHDFKYVDIAITKRFALSGDAVEV